MRLQRCKSADKYRAKRPPTCGCETCETRWQSAQRANARRQIRTPRPVPKGTK